jgi:hypothetical protein
MLDPNPYNIKDLAKAFGIKVRRHMQHHTSMLRAQHCSMCSQTNAAGQSGAVCVVPIPLVDVVCPSAALLQGCCATRNGCNHAAPSDTAAAAGGG